MDLVVNEFKKLIMKFLFNETKTISGIEEYRAIAGDQTDKGF
jgi:hypothetical protein